ncbi:hypothetical protein PVJ1_00020 [Psychrobacillus phage PVJ1]|nr:hypothetical protein PVJ1_00020 [Psychrobacillus phage PVJ1]
MPKWIPGQGFYLVQPSEPFDEEKEQREMDKLIAKLEEAEKRLGVKP